LKIDNAAKQIERSNYQWRIAMKKLTQTSAMFVIVLSLFAANPATAQEVCSADLIAGGGNAESAIDVGEIYAFSDGEYMYVDYVIDGDWCISAARFEYGYELADIPQKKGNPIPGQFEHHESVEECASEINLAIPLEDYNGEELLLAAHGVVSTIVGYDSNLEGFAAGLPDSVSMKVAHAGTAYGEPSYFDLTVAGGSVLDGIYDDYCIDTDRVIYPGTWYSAQVFSSYEPLPEGLVEHPENLDLLNYILNQSYPGQPSASGGVYTYGDVQRAIWTLIDDVVLTSGLGSWSQARANEIIADAQANGEGFVPGCGDYVGVIFVPSNNAQITVAQVTMAQVENACVPVYQSETAWPQGEGFPGKNWAMYMTCSL